MTDKTLYRFLKTRSRLLFGIVAGLTAAVIVASPFFPAPLQFLSQNPLARFCLFWLLAAAVVLTLMDRRMHPASMALYASVVTVAVCIIFCIFGPLSGAPAVSTSQLILSCFSGALLGALAGTWLIYVIEVYLG